MTWMNFTAEAQRDLIEAAISKVSQPDGVLIRLVDFEKDLPAIRDLPVDDYDTMVPQYGMAPQDKMNQITLIAVRGDRPIGQISADFEMKDSTFTSIKLFILGMFVSHDERGKRIGEALGLSLIEVAEAWRRAQAAHAGRNVLGEIDVSGDTEPQSGGERIEEMMGDRAEELHDLAYDEADLQDA